MKRTAAVFAGAALLMLCGCRSGFSKPGLERSGFDEISSHLVPGGSYYSVSRTVPLKQELSGLRNRLREALDAANLPEKEKNTWEHRLALAEFLPAFSGLAALDGWGASSVAVSPVHFDNRLYLLPGSKPSGVLWALGSDAKRDWSPYWQKLPADTGIAIGMELNREGAEVWGETVLGLAGILFPNLPQPGSQKKFFAELCGPWSFAAVSCESELMTGLLWQLSLPDKNGKLFRKLERFSIRKKTAAAGYELQLIQFSPLLSPVVRHAGGRLTIHNSEAAQKYFDGPCAKLGEQKKFRLLSQELPSASCGFLYQGKIPGAFLRTRLGPFPVDLFPQTAPELTIFLRQGRGILIEQRAATDWTQNQFRNQVLLPVAAASVFQKELVQLLLPRRRRLIRQRTENKVNLHGKECLAQLKKFYPLLQQYAQKHSGEFPAGENLAGWRTLISDCGLAPEQIRCPNRREKAVSVEAMTGANCSYAYFAGWKQSSSPKLPLVLDWPANHPDSFHVLYVDGSTAELNLKNPRSFRRMASYLYTLHRYDESDFRKLLERAEALDNLFNLE